MKDSTTQMRRDAVHRACRILDECMDQRLPVEEIASRVGLSPYHFQRLFKEVMGESVAQHHARLRIERGAYYLKFSSWQIQEIAFATGFESQAAFTRLFSRTFGMSPRAFRDANGVVPFLQSTMRSRKAMAKEPQSGGEPLPTVRLESWPQRELIVLRHHGPVESVVGAWQELLTWARCHSLALEECRFFGLWFDDWSERDTPIYRYECALLPRVMPTAPPPEPFDIRTIAAGDMAIAAVRGRIDRIDRAWKAFCYGWLPFSGYQPRLEYAIDEYPADLMLSPKIVQLAKLAKGFPVNLMIPVLESEPARLQLV